MSSSGFVRWCGLAASVAALAYTGLLLLAFFPFYLDFLQPYVPVRLLDTWSVVVLLPGVLAALVGLFPLLGERREIVPILFDIVAVAGVALLLWGAVAEASNGPAYPPAGNVLVWGLLLSAAGLLPMGIWVLISGVVPRWATASILIGAPPLAILLFPLVGPAWAVVGYALFREGSAAGRR